MHLFGDTNGPHLRHFRLQRHDEAVTMEWQTANAPQLRWRVLRSEQGFAATAEPPGANGQRLLNESLDTFLSDEGLDRDRDYFYTIFCREDDGEWTKQVEAEARPRVAFHWLHPLAKDIVDEQESERLMPTMFPNAGRAPWQNYPLTTLDRRDVNEWLSIGGD